MWEPRTITGMRVLEGIRSLWVGGTCLFVVSLGELTTISWGNCRCLCMKSHSKRMRDDLTGIAPKKGWRVYPGMIWMHYEWVTWWEHPGKETLLLIWVQSLGSSFVTSMAWETLSLSSEWFLADFGCLTTGEMTSVNSEVVIRDTYFHKICQNCFLGWERQNEKCAKSFLLTTTLLLIPQEHEAKLEPWCGQELPGALKTS